jgi:hypothetical protein
MAQHETTGRTFLSTWGWFCLWVAWGTVGCIALCYLDDAPSYGIVWLLLGFVIGWKGEAAGEHLVGFLFNRNRPGRHRIDSSAPTWVVPWQVQELEVRMEDMRAGPLNSWWNLLKFALMGGLMHGLLLGPLIGLLVSLEPECWGLVQSRSREAGPRSP